jgi:membrane associated rhomboid family serine protease
MIPLKDRVPSQSKPVILYIIIALNLVVFFYELNLGHYIVLFFHQYGVVPLYLEQPHMWEARGLLGQIIPFFTSMFLHGGWLHIIGNMWTLFIFGDNVEDRMGRGRFILFYALSGVASMTLHMITNWGSPVPAIGASGAIAGVMGAYLVYYPRAQIVTLLPIIFYFTIITVPAYVFLFIWFFLQFFNGAFALMSEAGGAGIAWWAHVGGFGFGALTARLFQRRNHPAIDVNILANRFMRN